MAGEYSSGMAELTSSEKDQTNESWRWKFSVGNTQYFESEQIKDRWGYRTRADIEVIPFVEPTRKIQS